MLYRLINSIVHSVIEFFLSLRVLSLKAVATGYSQSVGCLGLTGTGAVAIAALVVNVWPILFPAHLSPAELVRIETPVFGLPPAQILNPRGFSEADQARLLVLFYDVSAKRWLTSFDSAKRLATGQWFLDLLPNLHGPEFVEPDYSTPIDKRGYTQNSNPAPVLRYRGSEDQPGVNYFVDEDLREIRFILHRYSTPEFVRGEPSGPTIRAEPPPATLNAQPLDEGALQAARTKALVDAMSSGDMTQYNRLVEEHRKAYLQHGADPCRSGFAAQQLCAQ